MRRAGERRGRVARALLAGAALAALAAAPPARAAGVRLQATVDRRTVALGDSVLLEIRLESSEAPTSLELPDDPAFQVRSRGQSQESSFAIGTHGVEARRVLVVRADVTPTRAGHLTLPAVVAEVGGKKYESRPIPLQVLPAGAAAPPPSPPSRPPPPPGAPDDEPDAAARGGAFRGWEQDLVLAVEPDRREAFVGEQVTVSIWLYSPLGVVEYERFAPPSHDGFWSEELETPRTLQSVVQRRNGLPTRAYLLQRVALFATRAGALTLGPAELRLGVRVGGGSIWNPFPQVARLTRRSAPVAITVKPLPPGAPPGFEPLDVGTLSIEASAPEPRAVAGQPVAIRLTAAGEGNVRTLALPRLPAIPGARAFEPTLSEQVAPRGLRIAGSRTLETVLVPEQAGELVVPPVTWSWFDPQAGRYQTARTAELRIPVLPAAPGGSAVAGSNALAAGLRPIREDAALSRRAGPPWRSPLLAAALALPPLAFAGCVLLRRRSRPADPAARRRGAAGRARRRLARARDHGLGPDAADRAACALEVEQALLGYASDRLGRPALGLTRDALAAALDEAGFPAAAVRGLVLALDLSDAARFGGGGASPDALLPAAERAIELLEQAGPEATR